MKKKYKALMLDLDGTTIPNHHDGMPSQKVIDAVLKAHNKLFVCVVTGRPLWLAKPILDILQINNPTVLLGGSQIINGKRREYVYERPFFPGDIVQVLQILKPYHSQILIDEKKKSLSYDSSYTPGVVFNILIRDLTNEKADMIIKSISSIETITAHKIVSWRKGQVVLNISHLLANKQQAIFEVSQLLGIKTHEIIGVGDGYNDFPLLMACGLKVAMGNAVPELKAIADYTAPSVDEDGVADVIEKFILS